MSQEGKSQQTNVGEASHQTKSSEAHIQTQTGGIPSQPGVQHKTGEAHFQSTTGGVPHQTQTTDTSKPQAEKSQFQTKTGEAHLETKVGADQPKTGEFQRPTQAGGQPKTGESRVGSESPRSEKGQAKSSVSTQSHSAGAEKSSGMNFMVAMDNSQEARDAFEWTRKAISEQKRPEDSTIVLVHFTEEKSKDKNEEDQRLKAMESDLQIYSEQLSKYKCQTKTKVLLGKNIGDELCKRVKEEDIDTLVLGSTQKGYMEMFTGSISDYCLKNADCAIVLCKRAHYEKQPTNLPHATSETQKIGETSSTSQSSQSVSSQKETCCNFMVAMDSSEESRQAFQWVQKMLRTQKHPEHSKVTLVNFVKEGYEKDEEYLKVKKMQDHLKNYSDCLEELKVSVDTKVLIGNNVGESLCNRVREEHIDTLAMGFSEKGLMKMIMGSTTDYCVKNADCAVVICRKGVVGKKELRTE